VRTINRALLSAIRTGRWLSTRELSAEEIRDKARAYYSGALKIGIELTCEEINILKSIGDIP
jgi:hypothetical protein